MNVFANEVFKRWCMQQQHVVATQQQNEEEEPKEVKVVKEVKVATICNWVETPELVERRARNRLLNKPFIVKQTAHYKCLADFGYKRDI